MEWKLPSEMSASDALRDVVGGHPMVADILARRGYADPAAAMAFIDPACYTPAPASDLPDLEKAASRLVDAINNGERILVWGDFDVDGQTSTALLVDALRNLGGQVEFHVPNRLTAGHGVQTPKLVEYIRDGVQLIVTCDVGIAAHEAAEAAFVNGVDMLITDHHALMPTLPNAPAIVNPQRLPEGHALRDLPGVGVAYMLVQELYELAGRGEEAKQFLDLAALGIVADVAVQQKDTRYLLQKGIDLLRVPHRTGVQALMRSAQVDPTNMSSDLIGFQVGPRLNALGRLDDATLAVELLTTRNDQQADQIAQQLELLNNKRKQVEEQIYGAAMGLIASDPGLVNSHECVILAGANWHSGVIGIVASRIVEQYGKPAIMLSISPDGKVARGSARSVAGVNIGACIAACGSLLMGHGGHPGAAGLSLDADLIPQLRRQLSTAIRETRDVTVDRGRTVDAYSTLGEMTLEMALELNRLSPFGNGNPPITLMLTHVKRTADAIFGANKKHRRMTVEDNEGKQAVITWWRGAESPLPPDVFDLLVVPRINDYRGRRSLQLEYVDSRAIPGVSIEYGPRWKLIDLRGEPDPKAAIDVLALPPDHGVWVEALAPDDVPFEAGFVMNRANASAVHSLVIWTAPSGVPEMEQMLALTGARQVIAVGAATPPDSAESFIKRLWGLVKYAIRAYDGEVTTIQLAAATGQREFTARLGLDWLAAKGQIRVEWLDGERAKISEGGEAAPDQLGELQNSIGALLAEAAAYRAYFKRADLSTFFDRP